MAAHPTDPPRQRRTGWPAPAADPCCGLSGPLRGPLAGALGCALLAAVAGVALLDRATGGRFSLALLYCLPVAAAVWWCGFTPGVLLGLAAAAAWHWADRLDPAAADTLGGVVGGAVRFAFFAGLAALLARLRQALERQTALAATDALTGVANGRIFYERIADELERCRREPRPLTLVYFDVDDFKRVNDRLGHAAGDELLRCVAAVVAGGVRPLDTLARLGGDEFGLLLPATDGPGAWSVLERLRGLLKAEMAARGWAVTFSVGAATFLRPCEDADVLVHGIDALMYRAKRDGKDRVRHEVVAERISLPEGDSHKAERRAGARLACGRAATVTAAGAAGGPATVRDISAEGVAVVLERPVPVGTTLAIAPCGFADGRPLCARVVRTVPEDDGWLHGCLLASPLTADELRSWAEGVAEPVGPSAALAPAAGR